MSWHAVGPVTRLNLEATAKMVLIMLANEADDDSANIAVAIDTTAMKCGLSRRTVQRFLEVFEHHGVLVETPEGYGRGQVRRWRIDQEEAVKRYGRNPTFAQRDALRRRGEEPPKFVRPRMPEKGDSLSPFNWTVKGDSLSGKGDAVSSKGVAVAHNPIKDPIENPGRARDPAVSGSGVARASSKQTCQTVLWSAALHWEANLAALEAYFGESYPAFIRDLVPLDDDGSRFALGAQSQTIAGIVQQKFGPELGRLLGREVKVVHCNLDAARRRNQSRQHAA